MSLQLISLLADWYPERDACSWVLGTVYDSFGPVYRKPGALMLFGGDGRQLGLLSGGCLEADIALNARKVLASGRARTVTYDGSDEDDIAYRLGIGCGGSIDVLLQQVTSTNQYLGLEQIFQGLRERRKLLHCQRIPSGPLDAAAVVLDPTGEVPDEFSAWAEINAATLTTLNEERWFVNLIAPPPSLLIIGGGVDAQPVVAIAATLGWHIVVCDPRPANARRECFPGAARLLKCDPESLVAEGVIEGLDAAIVMSHKLSLDAAALKALLGSQVKYLALLGPIERRDRILAMADISLDQLPVSLAGPAGLHLGGDLPEGIALAILAECHAAIHRVDAHSISGLFDPNV